MKTIPISSVVIPENRQRKNFDEGELLKLGEAIKQRGVLHAIILRKDGENYVLVAGERRLRAITDLSDLGFVIQYDSQPVPLGHIPYTLITELNPLDYEEAELEENVLRVDLSWQERAVAVNRLAALRTKQAEHRGAAIPTVADISKELHGVTEGFGYQTTRQEILVAKHIDNPLIAAAKNVDEAFKLLKKEEQRGKDKKLGETVGKTFNATLHKALNESSLDWMKACPAEQFDVILTDPPYGMGADKFGDSGTTSLGAHQYADDWKNASACYSTLAIEGFRIAKSQAHLYAFCDIKSFWIIADMLSDAGWQVFETPLIWFKKAGFRAPWPELGPQRKYEAIIYAIKGKRPVNLVKGDVLEFNSDTAAGHPAQKPVGLYADLLGRSCKPGDTVLDPFMGSGPIFPAAHELKVRATGIELDPSYYGIAVKRLQELDKQLELSL
jgi:DNA modification methylase